MDENVEFTVYALITSLLLAASHHSPLKRKGALSSFCCFWFMQVILFCCSTLSHNKQYAMPLSLKLVTCYIQWMYSSSSWKRNPYTTLSWKDISDFGTRIGVVFWDAQWPDTWFEPICKVLLGLYFQYCTVPQSRELCNSCGLWCRGYLDRAGSRRSRSCWIHSPQHHFDGLGTPRRATKSRSGGKGQQALSISKAWAKAQPFIH